jgi:hypothetical protein
VNTKIAELMALGRAKPFAWGWASESLILVKVWADEEAPYGVLRAANLFSFADRSRARGMEWYPPIERIEAGTPTLMFRVARDINGKVDNAQTRVDMVWPVQKVVWVEDVPFGVFSQSAGRAV